MLVFQRFRFLIYKKNINFLGCVLLGAVPPSHLPTVHDLLIFCGRFHFKTSLKTLFSALSYWSFWAPETQKEIVLVK